VGILLTHHNESKYLLIVLVQIIKYCGALIVLWFLYFLYCKHLRSEVLLEQYKKIVDITALVSKTDLHGKITYANDSFVALSGYSRKELIGASHNIIRAPEMAKENFKNMWAMIQQGKIWQGKITNKKKNDERYTVNSTIIPLKNEYGNIIEYMAIRFDITELEAYRELLEHRLSNTNHDLKHHIALVTQYQNAIEKASAFCRFNPDGVITYVNETMCLISQCEESELLHQNVVASNLITEKTFQTIFAEVNQGKTWKGVIECNHKKDIKCFLDATFSPIVENEILQEIMCISHDITPIYNLYKEIEDTQKEVIFTMGAIGESRSKETGHHVKRVAEYSKLLATLYGLNAEEAELLKQASPMHDIGKIGISDDILQKPAKLSDEEWKLMQTHTQLGYDMLKHSSRVIFKTASLVALQHHEKWDGTGYPNHLKENEIHIYGRITAIADVFDALGSERCYKQAWEDEAIFELFKQERGKHFEPKLVDLFLDNIQDFIKIREELK
jgi:PAS domain S-box-containing protein